MPSTPQLCAAVRKLSPAISSAVSIWPKPKRLQRTATIFRYSVLNKCGMSSPLFRGIQFLFGVVMTSCDFPDLHTVAFPVQHRAIFCQADRFLKIVCPDHNIPGNGFLDLGKGTVGDDMI